MLNVRWFGFGDKSDWKIRFHKGTDGRFYWTLVDGELRERALPPFAGVEHGFDTEGECIQDARDVVAGLGADPKDLDVEDRDSL